MAHDLNYNAKRGQFSMFSAKEKPWHGLGQVVDGALTSEEAIRMANLDYTVTKGELWIGYPEHLRDRLGKGKKHPGSFITFREDTGETFGIVGSKYKVIQNEKAFSFFDDIVGFKEAIFETAGALGKGETTFITAKLPKHIRVSSNDVIERYLLFTNSHDGSRSIEVLFTPVRVVCNNTLQYALSTATNKFKIRHTKNADNRMEEARQILGIENTMAETSQELYKAMTNIRITDRQAYGYINTLFLTSEEMTKLEEGLPYTEVLSTRKRNTIEDVQSYYSKGPGQEMDSSKGTLWGAYNSITGYYNNGKQYKDGDAKMQNIIYGVGNTMSDKAFKAAEDIVRRPNLIEVYN